MDQSYVPQGELATQVAAAQNASQELSRRRSEKSKKKKFFILFIVLALAAIGVFLIVKGLGSKEEVTVVASPSPTVAGTIYTPFPEATSSPKPQADKGSIDIQVLNGTGISGEAGFLQSKLKALGYTNTDAGNASTKDNETTVVTFSTSLAKDIVSEITNLLESTYKEVDTKTSGSLSSDVQITTGLRSGQTPLPSASPTSSVSPSPSPTATTQ